MNAFDVKTGKRYKAVSALLSERTIADAARQAGISLSTLTRWLREPDFQAELREAQKGLLRDGLDRLSRSVFLTVETLEGLLSSRDEAVRLKAADLILNYAFRRLEALDLEGRLSELEARFDQD